MPLLPFLVVAFLCWVAAGSLSWAALRVEEVEQSVPFHAVGLGGWGVLAGATLWTSSRAGVGLLGGLALAVGIVLCGPFLFRTVWFALEHARRWYVGDDSIPPLRSHDAAEGFERRRQWDQAIRLYKDAVATDPADSVARLRISEIEAGRERGEEAISWARSALPYLADRERLTTVFRIADLHVAARQPDAARRALEEYLDQEPQERLRSYAQRRLESMKV